METQMHFRKRQLLAYQHELNSQLAAEQTIQIEYPTSPSSMNSGKSSPVGSETSADGAVSFEKQLREPINILSPTSSTKSTHIFTENAAALTDIENELQQSIEANINQQRDGKKPKPSTLILAKLNQLKENALMHQSKDIVPKNETHGTDEEIEHFNKVIGLVDDDVPFIKEKEELVIEEMCVVDFNDCYVVEAKDYIDLNPEYTPQVNDIITLVDKDSKIKTDPEPEAKPQEDYSEDEFKQIVNRITGVFAAVRHCQQRLEDFVNDGVNVYEREEIYHKSAQNLNNTPTATHKNPHGKWPANFIHITADTLPEEMTVFSPRSTPSTSKSFINDNFKTYPLGLGDDGDQLVIGPNGTTMSKVAWAKIDWSLSTAAVTRKILMALFDRDTLATHTLTGKPSPAFKDMDKPEKRPLDLVKVADIVYLVTSRINATRKEVRMAITTKCADECKMLKWRNQKKFNKKM